MPEGFLSSPLSCGFLRASNKEKCVRGRTEFFWSARTPPETRCIVRGRNGNSGEGHGFNPDRRRRRRLPVHVVDPAARGLRSVLRGLAVPPRRPAPGLLEAGLSHHPRPVAEVQRG